MLILPAIHILTYQQKLRKEIKTETTGGYFYTQKTFFIIEISFILHYQTHYSKLIN